MTVFVENVNVIIIIIIDFKLNLLNLALFMVKFCIFYRKSAEFVFIGSKNKTISAAWWDSGSIIGDKIKK